MYPLIKRDDSIDAIKGFLIICVVLGHFNYILLADTGPQQAAILINELIYLFHIPLFLIVSFIFVKSLSVKVLKNYAKKILIPYCFWVFIFFQPISMADTIPNRFKAMLYGTYVMGAGIFWFLAVLFVCKIMLSFYARISVVPKKRQAFWWVLAGLVGFIYYFYLQLSSLKIVGVTPFNFIMCIYLFPMLFFVNRAYMRKEYWQKKIPTLFLWVMVSGFIAYLMLLSERAPLHRIDLAQFVIPHRLDLIVAMVLLWASMMLLLDRLFSRFNRVVGYLSRVGFYSLPIYIFHVPVKQFLEDHVLKIIPENMVWTRVVVAMLVIILTCEFSIAISWLAMTISEKCNIIGLTKRPFVPASGSSKSRSVV